jgi:hypothetical protein
MNMIRHHHDAMKPTSNLMFPNARFEDYVANAVRHHPSVVECKTSRNMSCPVSADEEGASPDTNRCRRELTSENCPSADLA